MVSTNIASLFDQHMDSEFLRFLRVTSPQSRRPDLNAFLLLDQLVPSDRDIVAGAEHDEIYLDVNVDRLAAAATDDDIVTLIRCGVRYDEEVDSLSMFV